MNICMRKRWNDIRFSVICYRFFYLVVKGALEARYGVVNKL